MTNTLESLIGCEQIAIQVAYLGGWIEEACVIVSLCAILALAIYAARRPYVR